jgi:iron complex outermembrane receptor protein
MLFSQTFENHNQKHMLKLYRFRKLLLFSFLVCSVPVWGQISVSGTVTSSEDSNGLPGVSILEKGTNNGTVTNVNGNYSIVTGENATLVFSFVGFASQEITVGGRSTIDLVLQPDVTALNEVVVIGYGEVQRKDVTGSIVSVSQENFNKGVMSSPQDLLVGKVAGVQVTSNSGAPGEGSTIRIRGGSSVNASNDPLIVIDGYPVDNEKVGGLANPLSTLNPADIESFTVLKDASATAIYGSRASNGVIIITTKKGKAGKPQLSYNGQVSVGVPTRFIDVLNGDELRALAESKVGTLGIDNAALARLGTSNTDWQGEVFRNAISHDHNISLSGATNDVPFRISYGYTDQQGILETTKMSRHSLNIRLTPWLLNDNLKIDASFKGSFSKHNFGDQGAVGSAVSFDPTQPVMNGDDRFGGYFAWLDSEGKPNTIAPRNPVAMLEMTDNRSQVYRAIGNLQLDYRFPFLPDLRANVNMGFDQSKSDGFNNISPQASWVPGEGRATDYTGQNSSRLLEVYLNYIKELHAHKINLMAGYSYQSFQREGTTITRSTDGTKFFDYDLDYTDADDVDGDTIARQYIPNPNYLISFYGRLNYSFRDKYLVTATLRTDGSSRFAETDRWGLFPAVAVAWKVNEETFLAPVEAISNLKIRAGYGVTGQQDITTTSTSATTRPYPYLPVYQQSTVTAQYQFGDTFYNTLRPGPYDANIKWEETTTFNAGLDVGILKDRVTASFDIYKRQTKDLINNVPIPAGSNFSNFLITNVGNVENNGYEITLNTQPIKKSDLVWNLGFNLAHNENKITKLTATNDPSYPGVFVGDIAGGVGSKIQVHRVGYPAFSFYVFEQVYDAEGKPIEGLYVDRTGKGGSVTSDNLNKYPYYSPAPDLLMGLYSNLTYRNFDFSFSSRFSLGNYVYNNGASGTNYSGMYIAGNFFNNMRSIIHDTEFTSTQYFSDHYVEDASFFKMDNISAGYNFNHLFSDQLKARVSFTVQNAFMITDYKGLDPEVPGGIDNNMYPRPRVFLVGVNLTY